MRAEAERASRIHELREALGIVGDERSEAAEAGDLLRAATAAEIHSLHEMVLAYIEAHNSSPSE